MVILSLASFKNSPQPEGKMHNREMCVCVRVRACMHVCVCLCSGWCTSVGTDVAFHCFVVVILCIWRPYFGAVGFMHL